MSSAKDELSEPARTAGGEQRALRDALGRFATGVTVITTGDGSGAVEGLTVNSFASVSLEPPLVLWSLRRESRSLPRFRASGHFAVNVLSSAQQPLSQYFAKPRLDRFAGVDFYTDLTGCPLLPGSLAVFECATRQRIEAGDHVVFIGEVLRCETRAGTPLVFSHGRYHQLTSVTDIG